jgi:diaminopropionate ammonia-lyase
MTPRAVVNAHADPAAVAAPSAEARAFHAALEGYAPTPLRDLPALAAELGLAAVAVKDESARLGLPAFKVLGASWAVERALRERPEITALVTASTGNHGRAVARVARSRGLACRVLLPARTLPGRRAAIEGEGAEAVLIDGSYEDAVAQAAREGEAPGVLEVADVGEDGPARWVIDGYATLFAELAAQGTFDVVLVPSGVGALAAAAARHGAAAGAAIVAVEPVSAACLAASLAAGKPTEVATTGTTMAGLDCGAVSAAAWPDLRAGIAGVVTVDDAESAAAAAALVAAGVSLGPSGAAAPAALRALMTDPAAAALREHLGVGPRTRVALIGTEGPPPA